MIDRKIAPPFQAITELPFPDLQTTVLNNGQYLHQINVGSQPALKLEIIFEAGSKYQSHKSVATLTSKTLLGGTTKHTAFYIAERFSQYGGYTEIAQNADQLSFIVYGLSHHLVNFLPLICEILTDATFPEAEFDTQKQIKGQQLQVSLEKTSFIANQTFKAELFGENHPLGTFSTIEDITAVKRDDVVGFYEKQIKEQPFTVFLSGQFDATHVSLINDSLGSLKVGKNTTEKALEIPDTIAKKLLVEKAGSLQSTVRVGRIMFSRTHSDYFPFAVTNAVLGGYFGSRLMKNIREDKGFTYGISSSLIPMKGLGYFLIGTDVKGEFTQQTLDEMYKEIEILRNETISEEELTIVKNYIIGSVAGSVNNAFDIADKYKMLVREGLTKTYYEDFIKNINDVTVEDVKAMANKYLNPADLTEVVVGGK
ncbi:MAG: insulinase family protein [Spirosomaceae bacterium]|nr:insulinase family protein [Spirosomataceae bacterium]